MVRPNFIRRTLKGVGGKRFFDIPGVIYPEEVLKVKKGYCRLDGQPYKSIPPWGISSYEASVILQCSISAARVLLKRNRVCFRVVAQNNEAPRIYWKRSSVDKLAAAKAPPLKSNTAGKYLSTDEAAKILRIGRTTVQRLIAAGQLQALLVRVHSPQGLRKRCLIKKSELIKFMNHRRAQLLRAAQQDNPQQIQSQKNNQQGTKQGTTSNSIQSDTSSQE